MEPARGKTEHADLVEESILSHGPKSLLIGEAGLVDVDQGPFHWLESDSSDAKLLGWSVKNTTNSTCVLSEAPQLGDTVSRTRWPLTSSWGNPYFSFPALAGRYRAEAISSPSQPSNTTTFVSYTEIVTALLSG
jgi:hypothetical protein